MFPVHVQLGFEHIADLNAYDHILFIIALCAVFSIADWKKILMLVTAFTIGHSVTLALSALDILEVSPYLVELLIPVTILLTAFQNFWFKPEQHKRWNLNYFLALFFGFIHGMGFSNYFGAIYTVKEDFALALFAFNVGVELGQIVIVTCIMLVNFLVMKVGNVKQQYWNYGVSAIAAVLAIVMIIERI